MNKKGITISVLMIAVTLMGILAGVAIIYGTSSINSANRNKFESTIEIVEENVDLYYEREKEYPVINQNGQSFMVGTNSLPKDFKDELSKNGDIVEFLEGIDITKLKIPSIEIGKLAKDTDVFLLNRETGNVYYMKGIKVKGRRIYSSNK